MKKEAKKELFLDRYCKRQFAVIVENGKLTEFAIEEEPRTDIVGNIYKGKGHLQECKGQAYGKICCS